MTVILKSVREDIAQALADRATAAERAKLVALEHGLFRDVIASTWDGFSRDVLDTRNVPNLFSTLSSVDVLTPTGRIMIMGDVALPVPGKYAGHCTRPDIKTGAVLATLAADLAFRKKANAAANKAAYTQAIGVLPGFTTWAKLGEGWPEVMSVADVYRPDEAKMPAVINTVALNASFDLPAVTA